MSSGPPRPTLRDDARSIAVLAWPVLVGQLAVLGFSTVDTVLVGRHSAADLAAFAVGAATYVTVFIGLMGVVLAVGPIVGQLYGAKRLHDAGQQLHQSVWLALGLSLAGGLLLAFPAPFLTLSQATSEMADKIRGYLLALAFALPAALLFTAYRGFNIAVSRPKAVMALQLGGLALKVPLSWALVAGVPALGVPALGVTGCGWSTLIAMWAQVLVAGYVLQRDPFYDRFALRGRGLAAPQRPALLALLRLGVPMGLTILIEVTGFAFMAIFIARLGTTAVAGHQIAANLVSLIFMLPLSLSNATSTLVAQSIGAGRLREASRLGWHGLQLTMAVAALTAVSVHMARDTIIGWYTRDAAVAAAAASLLAFVIAFHLGDALQTLAQFVLRAWHVTVVSLVVFALSMWGVGLGGGYTLAFDPFGFAPPGLRSASGFWAASTAGLIGAGVALTGFLLWMQRERTRGLPRA
ncbi:MAG: MATE family efflux transporter [Ideonella sp.]|nr:MATE family efflux transporter [Ideonella sp.]MCC7455633.1 MATE family efflux transporter [Nitrospira sp.]